MAGRGTASRALFTCLTHSLAIASAVLVSSTRRRAVTAAFRSRLRSNGSENNAPGTSETQRKGVLHTVLHALLHAVLQTVLHTHGSIGLSGASGVRPSTAAIALPERKEKHCLREGSGNTTATATQGTQGKALS